MEFKINYQYNLGQVFKDLVRLIGGTLIITFIVVNFLLSLCMLAIIKPIYWWWYSKPFNILWGPDAFLVYQAHTVFTPQEAVSQSSCLIRINGPLDIKLWRERFIQNILNAPKTDECSKAYQKFTKTIVRKWGYFIWEDDPKFCVDDHIRVHSEEYEDDESLLKITQKLYHQPFPQGHPFWEVLLIPKKKTRDLAIQEQPEEHVACIRCHHSIADGTLIAFMFMACCDESTKKRFEEFRKFYTENPEKLSPLIKYNPLVRYLATRGKGRKLTIETFISILVSIWNIIVDMPAEVFEALTHTEKNNLHGAELTGRKLLAISEQLDLKLFKDISTATKCSVNDVLNCCIAGAFRKEDSTASSIRVHTALSGLMPGKFGTQNTTCVSHYDIELTNEYRFDRLRRISQTLERFKSSPDILRKFSLAFLMANHVPLFYARSRYASADATIGISNMFGPPFEIIVNGIVANDVVFFPLNFFHTGAVSVSCFSYFGKVRLGIVMDRAVALDDLMADRFLKNVVEELRLLHASI